MTTTHNTSPTLPPSEAGDDATARCRVGDWAETASHRKFWPIDPRPEDVCVADIARALSFICRFGGHCQHWYSVAQHSVLCADHAPAEIAPLMLLHDASEAYVHDIIRPLKGALDGYKEIERRWALAIGQRFNLGDALANLPPLAKQIDNRVLMTERRDIKGASPFNWRITEPPYPDLIVPWSPIQAEAMFLMSFYDWFQMDG